MPLEHVRLSQTARDQLVTLKRRTKIEHWNVLCRWALCRSLAEPTVPPALRLVTDSSVEMTWKVFAGSHGETLWALMRYRCHRDGLPLDEDTVANYLRLHLHRGIGYLIGDTRSSDIGGLVKLALTE
ncbi:DNA sulfur modification protein DndE [Rhodococcus sp. 05-2256-B2]|uniref:DNA sulfur modification protein DndE n=1 Tax=unclassified Rhodococcus (in: high G+C Gram-positive bacteria) TaxID=192944 RepID=UPI000B9A82D6|nr:MULTISPECIES: DNA sulfur modification protein DndE [unclassified Rhodococcus (in: high G+C Gram-positive bacteria)]OZD87675.1 DNA sulfur modification protein DndE [Rhodococcus sp. 05-2256-B4]OZD89940.1 DNA sulfur modification protein DndE [Rhodococcus sp. 05-2256-B2]OZD92258.1 DNA sulfur modification protein DndE [Rhodococcus sp. 05-2256-B3]OZD98963.1 DNA sulfur modification protein DndE [Rhodococcus sp. 05-2256-B1]